LAVQRGYVKLTSEKFILSDWRLEKLQRASRLTIYVGHTCAEMISPKWNRHILEETSLLPADVSSLRGNCQIEPGHQAIVWNP